MSITYDRTTQYVLQNESADSIEIRIGTIIGNGDDEAAIEAADRAGSVVATVNKATETLQLDTSRDTVTVSVVSL